MTLQEALKSGKWFTGPFGDVRYKFDLVTGKCTAEFEKLGTDNCSFFPREIFCTAWKLEPCVHEPLNYDMKIFVERFERREYISFDQFKEFASIATVGNAKCKHCGAKIKAEKWVEA